MLSLPLIVTAEDVMRLVKSEGKEGPGGRVGANNNKGTAKRRAHLKKRDKEKFR